MTLLDSVFQKPGTAIDPVCKMEVDTANPTGGTAEHEDETYYFCAAGCREEFKADPAKYA
jgi:Cu+-exporting ATPase